MKNPKPEHKFFETYLDNDLDVLFDYLDKKHVDLVSGNLCEIPDDMLQKYGGLKSGGATQLGQFYNIFTWDSPEILKLKKALKALTIEACEYYGIDYNANNYYINGWFNLDYVFETDFKFSPMVRPESFHDHLDGSGAPDFHGYYCVNAEPSITFYKINKTEQIFENINKNNRAILSETGHPHGRDDWYDDKPRITIAYDIRPFSSGVGPNWIGLDNE